MRGLVRFTLPLLSLVGGSLLAGAALALPVPELRGRINDHAGLLPPAEAARLEHALAAHEAQTGQQFALLTLPSLEGEYLEDFSMRVAERWRLGDAKRDDGLLVLVAVKERAVRIEVGHGLEGTLTDVVAARVIRNVIVPRFREGDYAGGVGHALDALMAAGRGDPNAVRTAPKVAPGPDDRLPAAGFVVALILFAVLSFMRWWLRSALGGVFGGVAGLLLGGIKGALVGLLGGALLGLAAPFLVALAAMSGRGRSSSRGFSGRSGGFSGGSGFSGGGGSFGGGGASGRW